MRNEMIDRNIFDVARNFHGAKGMIYIGEKVLVYRRDEKAPQHKLKIDIPGGGREGNESAFETFVREVKEEFGLDITQEDICYARCYQSIMDPTKELYFLVAQLPAQAELNIVFGDEGVEYMLVTPEDFLNRPDGIVRQKERFTDYLNTIQNKVF